MTQAVGRDPVSMADPSQSLGSSPPPLVVVGRIQGPYGVKGWVHVAAFTDPKENLMGYRPWYLGAWREPGAATSPGAWRAVEVAEIRPHKQGFVARIAGVGDRNQADALKGHAIGVPASVLPEPGPGEYYWRDLLGAMVVRADGSELGTVRDLLETGAHDVLVVAPPGGASGEPVLIPFHRRYVLAVDAAAGRIDVDWPDREAD